MNPATALSALFPPQLSPLHRVRRTLLLIAGIFALAGIIGWIFAPGSFYRAYLHGWLLWLDVSMGSLAFVMIIHLLGGAWGASIRRLAEAAAMVLPLMAVLFIPIAIGVCFGFIYPWAHGTDWRHDPAMTLRHPYLNAPFFIGRAVLYAICWIGLAVLLWRGSRRQDLSTDFRITNWLYVLSGLGFVLYVLTMGLFASTDWILSLEPNYKSTVFGLILITGQGVAGLCVLMAALSLLCRHVLPKNTVSADDWNDLGTVLLTTTLMYCYLEVCQFIIDWMGNTQGNNSWYIHRMSNGWSILSWILVCLHLLLPLLLLLMRSVKRSPTALLLICVMLLITRGIDGFWMTNPAGENPAPLLSARFSWLDVVLPVALGGFWIAGFLWMLERLPVLVDRPIAPAGATHAA